MDRCINSVFDSSPAPVCSCNIAGSAAFKKLIMAGKYQDAMAVARKQVRLFLRVCIVALNTRAAAYWHS